MSLTKLRELQEQADSQVLDLNGTHTVWSPGDVVSIALEKQQKAVEVRAALAPHLLPIAEALETVHARDFLTATPGHDCAKNPGYPMCDALKALKEALDE